MQFLEDHLPVFLGTLLITQLGLIVLQLGAIANRIAELVEKLP